MTTFMEKLEESGLDENDAKTLNLTYLQKDDPTLSVYGFKNREGILIPYFDHNGNIVSDVEGAPPFARFRSLDKVKTYATKSKSGKVGKTKSTSGQRKYEQPKNTPNMAYWPSNYPWASVVDDISTSIIFTEGEFKAAKACKEGFATIGFGGCHNWHLAKRDHELLPSLDVLQLTRRKIYICFDGDYVTKKEVSSGVTKLAEVLVKRGAYVYLITLPDVTSDKKTGLDDFLVYHKSSCKQQLKIQMGAAIPYADMAKLFAMNERYTLIGNKGVVVDEKTGNFLAKNLFKDSMEQGVIFKIPKLPPKIDDDGNPIFRYEEQKIAAYWSEWPGAAKADIVNFMPSKEPIFYQTGEGTNKHAYPVYNLWRGYPIEPVKGDVSLFTQFIEHIMGRHTEEEKKWLIQWLAAPFQKAPLKLATAVVTYSSTQGTGKTLLGVLMRHVYGLKYSLSVSEEQLRSNFNGSSKSTQFVVGDEITGIDSRRITDKLKDMITSNFVLVNEKHVSEYEIANWVNYYFTTNNADAFYIPADDRRYFIVGVTEQKIDNDFVDKLVTWFKSEEGKAALLHYFLNEVDLKDFNPNAAAPFTFAKRDMMEAGESELDSWLRYLVTHPEDILTNTQRDIFTSEEVLKLYDPLSSKKARKRAISTKLINLRIERVLNGDKLRVGKVVGRYFIIRNKNKWLNCDIDEVKKHIETSKIEYLNRGT